MSDTGEATCPDGLTVEDARARRICRICREPICPDGVPMGWAERFGEMLYPYAVKLDFGAEFAHIRCLEAKA